MKFSLPDILIHQDFIPFTVSPGMKTNPVFKTSCDFFLHHTYDRHRFESDQLSLLRNCSVL
jgi:hypothetical protein